MIYTTFKLYHINRNCPVKTLKFYPIYNYDTIGEKYGQAEVVVMGFTEVLLIIGIICIILSFFIGKSSSSNAEEIEKISISLHQEAHQMKKRIKALEEELLLGTGEMIPPTPRRQAAKPIHEIIVNQIYALHSQGYSIQEIAKRASVTPEEVQGVLRAKGVSL